MAKKKKKATLQGLTGDWVRHPHIAQDLFDNPDQFLATRKVKIEDYACPKEVHTALDRGAKLGKAMAATCADTDSKNFALPKAVKALRKTVAEHFGEDFIAESIPFGVLFKERAKIDSSGKNLAITGTGTCTFCKDNDSPDVD